MCSLINIKVQDMNDIARFLELEIELQAYKNIMSKAAEVIINEGVSKYPIFVVHKQEVEMGISLVEANKDYKWSINASTLEEFVAKNIIFNDKVEAFIRKYKDTDSHLCLFVLSELGAQFIYLKK